MNKKQIIFPIEIKAVNHPRSYILQKAFTNDLNSVELVFKLTDCTESDLTGATASILLFMRDGSFFQDIPAIVGMDVKYTLTEAQGNHAGVAQAQIIVKSGTDEWASDKQKFEIVAGLETQVATEVMIKDWTMLTAEARAYLDEFAANEVTRQQTAAAAESERAQTFTTNEAGRQSTFEANEITRQDGEDTRLTAEQGRVTAEQGRSTAETGRVNAESARVTAEQGREALNAQLNENMQLLNDVIDGSIQAVLESELVATDIANKLNAKETEYAPRLTEVERATKKVYTKSTKVMKPLISFYLDDGYSKDYSIVFPKAQTLGFPLTICLHNEADSWLSANPTQLHELISAGWEVHAHTEIDQDLRLLTYEQQLQTMKNNKDFLKNLGVETKGICYPRGYTNADTLKAARELFEVGMGSEYGKINKSPIDTYFINRELVDMYAKSTLEAMVDDVIANGGWIVFYTHTGQFPTNQSKFFELMDYVATKNVDVVTVSQAMAYYANTLDIGDKKHSTDFVKVGADGTLDITNLPIAIQNYGTQINSKAGTDFPSGKLSINRFLMTAPSDIPFNSGVGVLYTDRIFENRTLAGTLAIQRFEGFSGAVVRRTYSTSGGWSDWTSQGKLNTVKTKPYTGASPVTDFPNSTVTKVGFLSGEAPDLPNGGIGVLETNRIGETSVTNYQLFYPYNNNRFSKRFWTGSAWSNWQEFIPVKNTYFASFDFGSITGVTRDYTFSITGVPNSSGAIVNFINGLPTGVIAYAYVSANDVVTVRLFNGTGASVSVGARAIRLFTI